MPFNNVSGIISFSKLKPLPSFVRIWPSLFIVRSRSISLIRSTRRSSWTRRRLWSQINPSQHWLTSRHRHQVVNRQNNRHPSLQDSQPHYRQDNLASNSPPAIVRTLAIRVASKFWLLAQPLDCLTTVIIASLRRLGEIVVRYDDKVVEFDEISLS